MKKLITVTGLPRSGTAFVSMLLQLHPDCIAYHELAAYDRDWRKTIMDNKADIVADCNTYGFMPEASMPSDRMVYIMNDPWRSRKSAEIACRKNIDIDMIMALEVIAKDWVDSNEVFVIRRDDVFTVGGCIALWQYCLGGPIPMDKIEQLVKLNVQHKDVHEKFGPDVEFIL